MKFLTIIGVGFYVIVISLISTLLILFSLHILAVQDVTMVLSLLYTDNSYRIISGLVGLLLILLSLSFAQLILGKMQKERTIAFNSPSGRVTVALSAVEDLIKRMCASIPEVKELRPYVIAGKRGIEIDLKVILRSEINIPELTTRLQDMIKNRLQDILGIDEQIVVRIHVAKIVSVEEKDKKAKKEFEKTTPNMPFSGF
ncbi:MAG: alkaline shock response membrane anchor protein AmaP [Candidatus Omnitrophica bacterium]|nr:alkaline shock response membrane anchor protein AmaP [Candidatus Omnitrophota bacterium]MDD5237163.1 alkaline shock response membrane anchor protein AmaP [Candidatus Omnitrophota bacterium]MDD5610367.1 alkaline shock response membrane anchor protein AmaP [Candidatus Omnitrophota bacterium]